MKDPIQIIPCRTADELLDRLHPRRGQWPENFGGWLFRGHGDSRWQLLPSAFRAPSWREGFAFPGTDPTSGGVEAWERLLMVRFYHRLNRAGLPVPRGDELFRLLPSTFGTDGLWPDPVFEPLLALAQHIEIPTRLLDWTRSRKVAAYFAAVSALETGSEYLDVWALSHRFVEVFCDRSENLTCRIVQPLRHGNANLHAQAGVFTLCRGDVQHCGNFIPLDEFLRAIARDQRVPDDMLPCLRRFQLPTSEARVLLRDLNDDQMDAATLFPGYVGVVRALREERWLWQGVSGDSERGSST